MERGKTVSCLLEHPPINLHDVNAKRDADAKLAVEDPTFLNTPCPYGKVHKHGREPMISFKCKVCEEVMNSVHGGFRCEHRQCMVIHLKAR
jgi:hypothetical protein